MSRRRGQWMRDGLCTQCGATPRENRRTCVQCAQRQKESAERYRAAHWVVRRVSRDKHAALTRKYFRAKRDAGLCASCGAPSPDHSHCAECLKRAKEMRRIKRKIRREIWSDYDAR